ncbi:hypothetical protein PICMEDRAFT_14287 [Pichia membranifaciens NRRL Y-2026]|uniref:Ubiquitin-activating enzyme E1-like n=1 Tax=Pichia membranifaciens NRRL Y-2026 TaxID=763406 RepID=A0A1E3NRR5_9ASCO|nr:hypothetical protein PICMEDRAFT_14287 [Pichia membranifaciens NRRL Y-2026]ODQ48759.1 hypothetical protein PICMEDRAFT_14287 [Pichia membranifaciens NRRL Y-2026]
MAVDSYIKHMFGPGADNFVQSKVLLVGAGGIGCELLKNLIMMNIGEIHVLDLDTIDLSNLNRQFLFRHKDIKESKSKTAIKAVEFFNYTSKLVSYHGSVLDKTMFPLSFFQQFSVIYNALDNLEARFYVNRICLYLSIPLYESGTTGLKGQVQPIYPYISECFHCVPKETPKTFPVCTIRSTPSKPVHCITWAKDFLFSQLFGEGSPEDVPTPDASEFTSKGEAEASANEINELSDLRKLVDFSKAGDHDFAVEVFNKIFITDIERLLKIEDLWRSREKPSVSKLGDYEQYLASSEDATKNRIYEPDASEQSNVESIIKTYVVSCLRLADRLRSGEKLEFDKDDVDTLRFVMATSNIRSLIFHIPIKSEFDVKQIAGNIIPAVATMNAIMAGFSALSSVNYYLEKTNEERAAKSKMLFDSSATDKVVNSSKLAKPNPSCSACSIVKGTVELNLKELKLSDLRDSLIEKYKYDDEVEIMTLDARLLYDFDLEENLEKPLSDFLEDGTILLISDSDERLDMIELYIIDNFASSGIDLPNLTIPPKRVIEDDGEEGNLDEDELIEDGLLVEDRKDEKSNDGNQNVSSVIILEDDNIGEEPAAKRQKIN